MTLLQESLEVDARSSAVVPNALVFVTRPTAVATIALLTLIGAVAGARHGAKVVPRYQAEVLIAIEAQYHSTAQASVIATGGDIVARRLVGDAQFLGELGIGDTAELSLTTVPAGADYIRVSAQHRDAAGAERAAQLAAHRIVDAAADQRDATRTPSTPAPTTPAVVESPQLLWARESLDAHLLRRQGLATEDERARDRDSLLLAILERGAQAGRQGLSIQEQVSARVQSTLAGVTDDWYTFPLQVAKSSASAQPIRVRAVGRMGIGGAMMGFGAALVLLALGGGLLRGWAAWRRSAALADPAMVAR